MEGDTFVLLFLSLFVGVFALKSVSIPTGTGIVERSGGMFSRPSASFLLVLLIVIVLFVIVYGSLDVSWMKMEGGTLVLLSMFMAFCFIFALSYLFGPKDTPPPPPLPRSSGFLTSMFRFSSIFLSMFPFWSIFWSPLSWAAAMIAYLLVNR